MTSCKFYLKRETQERWILFTYEFKKEKKQFYFIMVSSRSREIENRENHFDLKTSERKIWKAN